jgi:hypothetical protein
LTGDSRPPGPPEGGWGHGIGYFERHYSGWAIWADAVNYIAQRKTPRGRRGPKVAGRTLDDLGAAIEAAPEHAP